MSQQAVSLTELAEALRSGWVPLAAHLEELEARFVARESELQAFLPEEDRFARLRREAALLEAAYPDPASRPPLFGVAVGVKDIFRADGFPTRAGSRLPVSAFAGPEAQAVSALKRAGALVAGKTVTTELAYFAPGPTRNPCHAEHTPGGSSSGSAAAVGAGLVPLALGTQTIGSIIRPAAFCGVVGFKPSYDRISRRGVLPLAPSLDHVGLFAAEVAGAQLAAELLCAGWKQARTASRKPVLGVPEGPFLERATATGLAQFRHDCEMVAEAGYEVRRLKALEDFAEIEERHGLILAAEAARAHSGLCSRWADVLDPRTADLIGRGLAVSERQLEEMVARVLPLRQRLMELMDEAGVDLWLSPGAPGAAPAGLSSTGDPVMSLPWTQAGLPAVSLPSGEDAAGLPLGLQIVGRWRGDEELLAWAREIEPLLAE